MDGQKVASQLHETITSIQLSTETIQDQKPVFSRKLTRRANGIIQGHREALKSVFNFYKDYDPQFTWWTTKL